MENKELGLLQIKARIAADKTDLGITSFKRTPTEPASMKNLPCIFMLEGTDLIIKKSARGKMGYPCQRLLEVVIELVINNKKTTEDIKVLFKKVRETIFKEIGSNPAVYNPVIADNVFINENRQEGPTGYGLPDIEAMRLVLDLIYTDEGF